MDICGWMVDGGVDEPYTELSVDDDFVVGAVPLESRVPAEPLGDALALLDLEELGFRRRRSLKKGIEVVES